MSDQVDPIGESPEPERNRGAGREPGADDESGRDGGAVWFFSGDLLFASRVQSAAVRAGRPFSLMGQWPETWTVDPAWIIVDLATRAGAAAEIIRQATAKVPSAQTIAYGPHVQPARLSKARDDGYASVLTRGQFDTRLPTLFSSTSAP